MSGIACRSADVLWPHYHQKAPLESQGSEGQGRNGENPRSCDSAFTAGLSEFLSRRHLHQKSIFFNPFAPSEDCLGRQ